MTFNHRLKQLERRRNKKLARSENNKHFEAWRAARLRGEDYEIPGYREWWEQCQARLEARRNHEIQSST